MGKSKFPGKPSRLVNKKRVSVLSPAGLTLSDEDNQENGQQQQQQQQQHALASAAVAGTAPPASPAGSPAPAPTVGTRTSSEKSAFAQRTREHQQQSSVTGARTTKTASSAGSLVVENENNGRRSASDRNNGDEHAPAASKDGADDTEADNEANDNDDNIGEEEEDEEDDDDDEEDEDEEEDDEDDDEDDDDEEEEDDEDEEEEDEECADGHEGGEAGDAGTTVSTTTTTTTTTNAASLSNGASSTTSASSSPATVGVNGASETRTLVVGAGQSQPQHQQQQQQTTHASSSKLSVTGNGFEMKPSSLSSALARRCSPSGALSPVSGRTTRQQSPSCQSPTTVGGTGAPQKATPDPSDAFSTEHSSPVGDTSGCSTTLATVMGTKPPVPSLAAAPVKKKSVTFHATLETTDENIVRKVYNPASVPLPSIIKKECLAHPIRLKKSFNRKMKKRQQRAAAAKAAAAAAAASGAGGAGGAPNKTLECIVRPSRLTEIVLKSSNKSSTAVAATGTPSSDGVGGLGFGLKAVLPGSANGSGGEPTDSGTGSSVCFGAGDETGRPGTLPTADGGDTLDTLRNLESGGTQFGDKRFILPKRSAHSSRVIKPNKRFLDEFELEIKKKNKNLAAAAAAAAAAGAGGVGAGPSTSAAGSPATSGALGSNRSNMSEGNGDDNNAGTTTGEETKRKKDKKKVDDATMSSEKSASVAANQLDHLQDGSSLRPAARPPMKAISINPFAKTSLTDPNSGKLVKPSQLSPAGTATAVPASATSASSTTANLSTAASIFGKSILRQPRLQFATSLLNSSNGGSGTAGIPSSSSITSSNSSHSVPSGSSASSAPTSATSGAASSSLSPGNPTVGSTEGLFSMHLKAKAKLDSSKIFSAALAVAASVAAQSTSSPSATVGGTLGSACAICCIPVNSRYYAQPAKKYGVSCCDVCRKFISKMIKKLANNSSSSTGSPNQPAGGGEVTMLKCKNEAKCLINPPVQLLRPEAVKIRHVFKERCHACWLRKCLGNFQLPPVLKIRLGQTLPLSMRTLETLGGVNSAASGSLKKDASLEGNLFSSSIADCAASSGGSRILWNSGGDKKGSSLVDGFGNKSSNPFLTLHSNPLSQNNSTFGSLPQLKLTLGGERHNIMSSPSSSSGGSSSGGKSPLAGRDDLFTSGEQRPAGSTSTERKEKHDESSQGAKKEIKEELENVPLKAPRTRSKSEAAVNNISLQGEATVASIGDGTTTPTSNAGPTQSTTTSGPSAPLGASQTAADKRQRIDLKGPRVKHVCRSASIVLGQPLATFPDDATGSPSGGALENIETPPSDSAAEPAEDLPLMDRERRAVDRATKSTSLQRTQNEAPGADDECNDYIDPTVTLSPPATPDEKSTEVELRTTPTKEAPFDADTSGSTEKELVIDEDQLANEAELDEGESQSSDSKPLVVGVEVQPKVELAHREDAESKPTTTALAIVKKLEDGIDKPMTRKTASFRPQATGKGPANISGRKQQQSQMSSSLVSLGSRGSAANGRLHDSALISIDFWENYDPAEVSRTGFGLILSETMPVRALCFLCGSAGLEDMLFCVCCCEPYHQYCVKDEYNLRTGSLDDTTNLSLLDVTLGASPQQQHQQLLLGRFNWMCPRCTVCYSCNMATGAKVKCQKCAKHYHTTCLGTSKRLHGADRPLICAACLRCKSCGTTSVTKFIGNLPMCTPCFRLRQKGNYCPLCQKCYEDNDFDLKMMECGDCRRWVHARCEGLTDEQYNMLSVLPENIEFICKKCGKHNDTTAHLWRDAVAAEFKAGLLSVVKLLSKSRQACALLKLSPRKKTPNCTCGAGGASITANSITNGKNISFFSGALAGEGSCPSGVGSSAASASKKPKLDEDSIYDFSSENSCGSSSGNSNAGYAVVPGGGNSGKCYCAQKQAMARGAPNGDITLVDIKQKINANEYYSLQDFHYDMNSLLNAVGSEELTVAYKEFLSETFPWFQNETKACTDALEEAMCGEVDQHQAGAGMDRYNNQSSHGGVAGLGLCGRVDSMLGAGDSTGLALGASLDQKVPQIDIPLDELTDYFHEADEEPLDTRSCMLCKQQGEGMPLHESRLLYCGQNNWVHTNCALWSAEVFEEIDGSLQNVHSAASRGRLIKCCHCGIKGATVGCNVKNCGEHYHFPCARQIGCVFMMDKTVYCAAHAAEAKKKRCSEEKNFEIARSVYVELDRRKKRYVEPGRVQFMIGSLNVRRLGHVVPMFSDHEDVIIPTDFECTRLYWSSKEPWKIVSYRIKTTIQNNSHCYGMDLGKNFTVDHSSNSGAVQWGLTQIARWHTSLDYFDGDDDQQQQQFGCDSQTGHFHQQQQHLSMSSATTMTQMHASTSQKERQLKHQQPLCDSNPVCSTGDDTNDEEPQNTNDLLPPEIKDAIFEDLPHDILDGISMLDILPKLMTYEDLLAMDLKNDTNFSVDMLKETIPHGGNGASSSSNAIMIAGGNSKPEDHGMEVDDMDTLNDAIGGGGSELSNDSWTKTIGAPGVEDALLSAMMKPAIVGHQRELKRSKSDILGAIAAGQQQHQQQRGQRSASFSWNTKQLESTAAVVAKRRKIAKNNIKLSEVFTLGRIKEDSLAGNTAMVLQERRKSLQSDEFPWASVKKTGSSEGPPEGGVNVFEKLKISQLDGVDDICLDGGASGGVMGEMKIYSSRSMIEAPVKCDRCQATYRNQESYQRHLSSCEVLSTSESESETRSPRLLSPEQQQQQQQQQQIIAGQMSNGNAFILPQATAQQQTITTDIYGNTTTGYLAGSAQSTNPTISVLQAGQTINLNGNQAILSNLPTSMPITINQLSSGGIPIQTSAGTQQIPLQGTLQAGSVGLQNIGGNMIISTQNGAGQLFATANQFSAFQSQQQQQPQQHHQVLQDANTAQFVHNKQRFIQPAPTASPAPQTLHANAITLQNNLTTGATGVPVSTAQGLGNIFTQQPQIISIGPNGQLMAIPPPQPQQQQQQHQQVSGLQHQQPTTILQSVHQPMGMQNAKKVVYTTASPKKHPAMAKVSQQQGGTVKPKRAISSNAKASMQIKTKPHESPMTIHPQATMITTAGGPQAQLQATLGNGHQQVTLQQQQQQQQQQIQLINTSYPLIRPASTPTAPQQTTGNIIFQTQTPTNQPILVQQVGGNQISYLSDQGTLTHSPVQYQLAPTNVLTQNGYAMTTAGTEAGTLATANNILIPNGTGGYSLIPAGALQIATQPQVIGTIVQPQAATIQCGMMSTEQMVLGATAATATAAPTLEMMVTDPASGCMYLTSPSVYYGLETIVQNTVMSSQQFVSTAMQGVLSQNSSFSATTTQVFAASKIEPIVEMPTGYVVLNNDGTTHSTQQMIAASTAQAGTPVQIQTSSSMAGGGVSAGQGIFQQAQLHPTTVVSSHAGSLPSSLQTNHQPITSIQQQQQHQQQQVWKIEPSSPSTINIHPTSTITTSASNTSTSIVTPLRPSMKTIIPKVVNKVMPNTAMKVQLTEQQHQLTTSGGTLASQKSAACYQSIVASSVYTTATALTTSTKVSNVIKPITKTTNYNKPKIVAKPVKQKAAAALLLSQPSSTPLPPTSTYQMSQQQQSHMLAAGFQGGSITLVPASSSNSGSISSSNSTTSSGNVLSHQSHLVPIKPSIVGNAGGITLPPNQLTVSAIKQPIVVEKISSQQQPSTNGIGGGKIILQPNSTLKKSQSALGKKQDAKLLAQKGIMSLNHNQSAVPPVQLINYQAQGQQQHQIVAQHQNQQPFQQLITSSAPPTPQQGHLQQQQASQMQQLHHQQQQQQAQQISIQTGKGQMTLLEAKKKSSTAGQITMSLANGVASSIGGPVPVSMPASTITITPSQPASITLPTAPYPMPLYSNIPTNVVNPIQQTTGSNNTISSSTSNSNTVQIRPTNRVLPMQASVMLQKNPELPQTPPPASLKVPLNHHQPCSEKMEDISIIPSHPPNTPFDPTPVSSPNDPNDRMMKLAGSEKLPSGKVERLEIEIKPIEVSPMTQAIMTPTTTMTTMTTANSIQSPIPSQQKSLPQAPLMIETSQHLQQEQQQQQQEEMTTPSFQFSLSFDENGTLIPIGSGHIEHQQHVPLTAQIEIKPILPTINGNSSTQAAGMQSPLSSGSPGMQLTPASEIQQPMTPTAEMIQSEAQHELDTATQRIDELKHSLEAETQEMLAEGHESLGTGDGGDSGVTSPSLNDESDSPEIKDKISEILDNLEQQTNQETGGLNHQSDEMQLQSYADLGQAKEQSSQEQTNALLEALSPASQQQQLHQQTLETEAECAAETERIVAELNEEFRSAATSPSVAGTASTVPLGPEQQASQSSCMVSASSLEQSLMTISSSMFDTKKHEVCFTSDLAGYNGLTTSGGMDIDSDLLNDGDAESVLFGKIRQPEPSPLSQPSPTQHHHHQQLQLDEELQQYTVMPPLAPLKQTTVPRSTSPKLLYEIQSQDGFTYKSTSIAEIWDKLFEAVQIARRAHGLTALPEGQLKEMAGVQMLGLKTNAIRYLLEQLPGVEKCTQYNPLYHKKQPPGIGAGSNGVGASANGLLNGGGNLPAHADYFDDLKENPYGTARCEPYSSRSEYDMFSWLASRHRKQPMPIVAQTIDDTIIPRRGSGSNLPMAMRYRTLKESSKESVGVYRSHIHGRGLFCNRDIEAGEMVIEYAGELIRSTLTDKRERYYDGRGIGCYMFKIDENFVVDATMRGNAARFINHSCEPNCYSKVVDILGHKHIIIFALRRIVQGEELTYDYKFPFEDVKIPCSCGSKKCRKYLN